MKRFKLRTDLTIEVGEKTLYRIEATKDIERFGVKAGDLGGYIEKEDNLSGIAWVSGNAKVYGNAMVSEYAFVSGEAKVYGDAKVSGDAEVYGNAKVSGDDEVYGDKIEKENDLINITSNVDSYNITITPKHIKIGCQYHSKTAWFNFTDDEIMKMDGEKAVNWWKTWKPILKQICDSFASNEKD